MSKNMIQEVKKHSQLCWDCQKACGGCSWSRDFTPVPGWKAKPTKIISYTTNGSGRRATKKKFYIDSFAVYECPEFEPLNIKNEEEFLKIMQRNIGRIRRDQDE